MVLRATRYPSAVPDAIMSPTRTLGWSWLTMAIEPLMVASTARRMAMLLRIGRRVWGRSDPTRRTTQAAPP